MSFYEQCQELLNAQIQSHFPVISEITAPAATLITLIANKSVPKFQSATLVTNECQILRVSDTMWTLLKGVLRKLGVRIKECTALLFL